MRYRVLLSHHVLAVCPLLELSTGVSPSAADLASYTLKLEATYSKVGAAGGRSWPCLGSNKQQTRIWEGRCGKGIGLGAVQRHVRVDGPEHPCQ